MTILPKRQNWTPIKRNQKKKRKPTTKVHESVKATAAT